MKKRILLIMLFVMIITLGNIVQTPVTKAQESITLKVKSASMTSVTLSWNKSSGSDSYAVYRSEKKDSGFTKIATVHTNTYKNTNLSTGKTYYYKIKVGKVYSNVVRKLKVVGYDKSGKVYGTALTAKQKQQVGDRVAYIVNTQIKPGMSDLEKVKAIHDYIVDHCKKAASWRYHGANTAWGALIYGEAQCSGYARAFKAVCDAIGMGCYHVYANSKAFNPSHQWNMVKVDGNWYHIDLNCNDNSQAYVVFLLGDTDEQKAVLMDWDRNKYPKCKKSYNTAPLFSEQPRKYSKNAITHMKNTAKKEGFVWSDKPYEGTVHQGYLYHQVIFLTQASKSDFDYVEALFNKLIKSYKKHFKGFELFVHVERREENNEVVYYYRIGTTEENMSEERLEQFCNLIHTFEQE